MIYAQSTEGKTCHNKCTKLQIHMHRKKQPNKKNVLRSAELELPWMPLFFLPCVFFPSANRCLFFFFFLCNRSHLSFTWVQCWHPSLGQCWHTRGADESSSLPPLLLPPSSSPCTTPQLPLARKRLCTSDTRVSSKGDTAKVMPDNIKFLAVAMATWPMRTCEIH